MLESDADRKNWSMRGAYCEGWPVYQAVPFARGGGVDRARILVEHGLVDGPALAIGPSHRPVLAVGVALEHEQSLACPNQQQRA